MQLTTKREQKISAIIKQRLNVLQENIIKGTIDPSLVQDDMAWESFSIEAMNNLRSQLTEEEIENFLEQAWNVLFDAFEDAEAAEELN
jgi:hypothetical protein